MRRPHSASAECDTTGGFAARPPTHMAHAIEVAGLTKRFGDVLAVDDLSFTVDEGRVVGVLGPDGAGKTTTPRVLLGAVEPAAGPPARPRQAVLPNQRPGPP